MSPIKFIYFDIGNVLITVDHALASKQIAELIGISWRRVEQVLFDDGLQDQYERGEISTAEFHKHFCRQTQTSISVENLCFAASNIFEPLADSVQLLETLKQAGYRLGLLSNTCDCHWSFLQEDRRFRFLHNGIEHYVLSFVAGLAKPDRDIYRLAADLAGCSPGSILFIDDLDENVKAAQACGIDGILFKNLAELLNELSKRELIH